MHEVTQILSAIRRGEPLATEELLPLVYDELRRLAKEKMAQEKPGQTLEPTALVHEVYLRLVDVAKAQQWDSRGHFFSAASEAMRRILVEGARRKGRLKRGSGFVQSDLDAVELIAPGKAEEILAIDDALAKLQSADALAERLVRLRYFGGLTQRQAAEVLDISPRKADQVWAYARAWLLAEMGQKPEGRDFPAP